MGFEAPGTGRKLSFAGTKYEGLEVTVDSASIGLLTEITEHYAALMALTAEKVELTAAMPALNTLIGMFAGVLESWNVTKRGEPVPPTVEGMQSLDAVFVLEVIGAWLTGTTQADEALGKDSPSGASSQEVLTAAADLSSALPSSGPQRLLSGSATGGTCCRRRCSPSLHMCSGCSISTGWVTATRSRREVNNRRWQTTTSTST